MAIVPPFCLQAHLAGPGSRSLDSVPLPKCVREREWAVPGQRDLTNMKKDFIESEKDTALKSPQIGPFNTYIYSHSFNTFDTS